ncbi:MAG: hypothetical protein WDA60_19775 [Acidimicrobiia bacterium]|jgi:hypothetical protein
MSHPQGAIQVDPDRVIAILCADPLGKAQFERAQWQAAYEQAAEQGRQMAGELQTAREALDAAAGGATPPGEWDPAPGA